jgi:hypothetical protein
MAHVDARVDHGHCFAGPGGLHAVGADHGEPPLQRDQRIRRLEQGRRPQQALRAAEMDDSGSPKLCHRVARHAPDAELACELRSSDAAGEPGALLCLGPLELHELRPGRWGGGEEEDEANQKPGRQATRVLARTRLRA